MNTRIPQLRAGRAAGFTMVEIALCLAIIGFALVAIIGVLPIGMNTQKDNREETLINFDANYLMNAIRSGSPGQEALTNFIVSITNIYTHYDSKSNILEGPNTNWYNTTTWGINNSAASPPTNMLNSGTNIVGLLTTPRFTRGINGDGDFFSNYVTADFRALTGSPLDQGNSQGSKDFAFTYRVFPEIRSFSVGPFFTNNLSAGQMLNLMSAQQNYAEVRLSFRWPVLGGGILGQGKAVYRSAVGGQMTNLNFGSPPSKFFFFVPNLADTNVPSNKTYIYQ